MERAILELLEWFDTHEGTTYLYSAVDRDSFCEAFDEPLKTEVRRILDKYHIDMATR